MKGKTVSIHTDDMVLETVTRETQQMDVLYWVVPKRIGDPDAFFVTPDGEGRFWYDTFEEAGEQHGDLPVVAVLTHPED